LKVKGVVLSLKLEEENVVYGDALSLGNSIQNLIENAVVYNDQVDKRIEIRVFAEGKKVKMIVADNGPGISESESLRVFDRFYRGEKAKRMPGSGLGLFLTKSMVEAHSGTIRLLKDLNAKGCQIEIALPAMGAA
jgi:signal transduction histidine kinase